MKPEKKSDDKYLISLSDILLLFRRGKRKIITCALLFGIIGSFIALTKPVKYRAEGTFREKVTKTGQMAGLAQALFSEGGLSGSESEAISLMKSRKLMTQVVKKLNLQGQIFTKCDQEGVLSRIKSNLRIEWSRFKKSPFLTLKDLSCTLKLSGIQYSGEVPIFFDIYPVDQDKYQVYQAKKMIGEGVFNEPYNGSEYAFVISKVDPNQPLADLYHVNISPLNAPADALIQTLEIETSKNDKGILKFAYENRDRKFASQLINTVMEVYQEHIKTHHNYLASKQMDYLIKRRDDASGELKNLLDNHAEIIMNDLSLVGVADAKKEMEFLAKSHHDVKDQLLANELEIKRLKQIKPSNYAFFDRYANSGGSDAALNEILREIRVLKQERDGFEIALRKNSQLNGEDLERSFQEQVVELQKIQQYKLDLSEIMLQLKSGENPNESLTLLQNPKYLVKAWLTKLDAIPPVDKDNKQKIKDGFGLYLENLGHLFNVHEKILQERLTHQQSASGEYQGVNLMTSKNLYVEFCKLLSEEESDIKRTQFFLNHLDEPDFEISSLSYVLKDPVSADMISKASRIVLSLKDENNQSTREQGRLKEELNLERTFLKQHLKQMIQLKELNKKLLEEKIYVLQNVNLELTHQQISLLEKNFYDYVRSRLENLDQERGVIKHHLKQIQDEIATLPKKRSMEKLIDQELEINLSIMKEIAKIVESKTISHNLEIIQSAPIDASVAPVHPMPAGLFTLTLLGTVLGGIGGCALALVSAFKVGIRATVDNLKILEQHVSGKFSSKTLTAKGHLKDDDLETLRRLQAYFYEPNKSGLNKNSKEILLIESFAVDYSFELADLLSKKGLKVLVLDLDFDRSNSPESKGLLQYLQKHVKSVPIVQNEGWDHLPAGGVTRFSNELLTSQAFKELMEDLGMRYDWILAVSHARPLSAEAESLVAIFPNIALTLTDEKIEDLNFYVNLSKETDKKLTFILG